VVSVKITIFCDTKDLEDGHNICFSDMLVNFYHTIQHHNQEDINLQNVLPNEPFHNDKTLD
jgi:hypothetical protein